MMKKWILIVCFIWSACLTSLACDCPEHPGVLTIDKAEAFDIIFRGIVDSTGECNRGKTITRFRGLSLYKGIKVPRVLDIRHRCLGSCKMPFTKGSEWLLFVHRDSTGGMEVSYCERNRKKPVNPGSDEYTLYNEMTWVEENEFLAQRLLPAYFIGDEDLKVIEEKNLKVIDQNRDIRFANGSSKIIIILASLAGFLIIYLVVRKFFKQ
jgi:hypothetical protein